VGFAYSYGAEIVTRGYRRNALEEEARDFVRRHEGELRERHRSRCRQPPGDRQPTAI